MHSASVLISSMMTAYNWGQMGLELMAGSQAESAADATESTSDGWQSEAESTADTTESTSDGWQLCRAREQPDPYQQLEEYRTSFSTTSLH